MWVVNLLAKWSILWLLQSVGLLTVMSCKCHTIHTRARTVNFMKLSKNGAFRGRFGKSKMWLKVCLIKNNYASRLSIFSSDCRDEPSTLVSLSLSHPSFEHDCHNYSWNINKLKLRTWNISYSWNLWEACIFMWILILCFRVSYMYLQIGGRYNRYRRDLQGGNDVLQFLQLIFLSRLREMKTTTCYY